MFDHIGKTFWETKLSGLWARIGHNTNTMENWTDQAIILNIRPHGESAAVVRVLTRARGKHAGYVHRARASGALRGSLDIGNMVTLGWASRAEDQLGTYTVELDQPVGPYVFDDQRKLLCVQSLCALLDAVLPEREKHAALYEGSAAFLAALDSPHWMAIYVMWEMALLAELGFGLDLSCCAVSGTTEDLVYISPKSGRAVSRAEGALYKDKLFLIPDFLNGGGDDGAEQIGLALRMTAHFLRKRVFEPINQDLPEVRRMFEEKLLGMAQAL